MRDVPWKGHSSKANVRKAIEYSRKRCRHLRIFALGAQDGWATYTEIPAEQWDALFFAEGEARP